VSCATVVKQAVESKGTARKSHTADAAARGATTCSRCLSRGTIRNGNPGAYQSRTQHECRRRSRSPDRWNIPPDAHQKRRKRPVAGLGLASTLGREAVTPWCFPDSRRGLTILRRKEDAIQRDRRGGRPPSHTVDRTLGRGRDRCSEKPSIGERPQAYGSHADSPRASPAIRSSPAQGRADAR
jgi:hypothetical protein